MNGIMFTEPLFHAVIEGRKTQTRRIIKPQPDDEGLHDHTKFPMSFHPSYNMVGFWGTVEETGESKQFNPRYKLGDTVYLKEPYYEFDLETILYKYRGDFVGDAHDSQKNMVWENKLFMPAKYARYFIEITGVYVERLQDISDEDCLREGILLSDIDKPPHYDFDTPQEAYAALINNINGEGTWDRNPYVWVYDFKLVK